LPFFEVPQKEDAAKAAVKTALGVLEAHLLTRTYLVGDSVTVADIIAFCNLLMGFTHVRTAA
jgi:glutathione S-transferase